MRSELYDVLRTKTAPFRLLDWLFLAKDKVKQLLDNAMKGFEESGRIQPLDSRYQTPLPEVSEEKKSSNIELDNLKGAIER